ncbi:MAG: OmpA family protein [candidate division WOR-3 bacterium]|nr:OmpA family protein [candidate division WOR-3 bacterium]
MGRRLSGMRAVAGLAVILFSGCAMRQTFADLSRKRGPAGPEEIKRYERFIKRSAPGEQAFVALERVAEPYIRAGEWEQAAEVYERYRKWFDAMDERFEKVIALLEAEEEGLVVANLGQGINTSAHEGLPVPTADGRYLYFTGKDRADGFGEEDIFVSIFENGRWGKAENLGAGVAGVTGVNTMRNESLCSISADGNRLILFGNYQGSFGSGDIFYSDRTRHGWGRIQHLPRPINSIYFESDGFATSDGKAILFTSDRPGNIGEFHPKDEPFHGNTWGNTDIYVSQRTEQGWSEPINLGPIINTPYAERTPFLHPDGKTLYFSSDGHYGLGRLDVFKTVRLSETSWTEWSEPRNLGKQINTAGDDWGYTVSTSGEVAYFAAYGGYEGYGGYDIYSITLPGQARPEAVATIRGKVTDEQSKPLAAAIKWEDLATGENAGELRSNPQDGSYFIVLPLGANYGYYAEKEGYYPVSKNVDLTEQTEAVDITEDIALASISEIKEKGTAVRINNIFFEFDRYSLRPESFPELDRLAKVLKESPDMKVEIAGHTDNVGTEEYNLELSRKRAQSVVGYLISVGCSRTNLIPMGYGEKKPIDTNDTEQGRASNRRVEFKFLQ